MIAFILIVGIIVGAIGLFLIANYFSKKDNDKFDPENKPKEKFVLKGFWPEGFQSPSDTTWKSTTETRFTVRETEPKKKEKSLEDQLQEALDNEEYEIAAKLRDKIKSKTKK